MSKGPDDWSFEQRSDVVYEPWMATGITSMDRGEFSYDRADAMLKDLLDRCLEVSTRKRREYTEQSTNALENFDETARRLNLTPEQVLWVHLDKHLSALRAHSVDPELDKAEDLMGRFVDAINYLSLLACMFRRRGRI